MSDTLPPVLAQACDAYDKARDALFESVESWLFAELAALSARVKGRTVTLYSGNGTFSIHIERRRPLTSGDYAERKEFIAADYDPSRWARWLAPPAIFAQLAEVERQTEFSWLTPIGAFTFRDGQALEQES